MHDSISGSGKKGNTLKPFGLNTEMLLKEDIAVLYKIHEWMAVIALKVGQ